MEKEHALVLKPPSVRFSYSREGPDDAGPSRRLFWLPVLTGSGQFSPQEGDHLGPGHDDIGAELIAAGALGDAIAQVTAPA